MAENISSSQYVVGGYYLIRGSKPQKGMNAEYLPTTLWSASRCICEKVPDAWIFTWTSRPDPAAERKRYQRELELSDAQILDLMHLYDRLLGDDEFGYPNVFMSYRSARDAYARQFWKIPDLKLISISLQEPEVQNFIDAFEPQTNVAENGVRKKLRQNQKLESIATPIGCEVIGYDYADFHSLICGSLEKEIFERYGVGFNRYGLINSIEDALPIVQDIRSGTLSVEEGYWAAWLMSEYPVSAGK